VSLAAGAGAGGVVAGAVVAGGAAGGACASAVPMPEQKLKKIAAADISAIVLIRNDRKQFIRMISTVEFGLVPASAIIAMLTRERHFRPMTDTSYRAMTTHSCTGQSGHHSPYKRAGIRHERARKSFFH
jgi:hypothetical protein